MDWILRITYKIFDAWDWVADFAVMRWYAFKFWLHPDARPTDEILGDVVERLSRMPASREIHDAVEHIEKARAGGRGKENHD